MNDRSFLILGIDGATFDVIKPLVAAGELPHLGRLMEEGVWGPLRSTIHPLTPQAWATFMTGTNPGKHGIFDFGYRAPGAYRLDLSSSATRQRPGFWKTLNQAGVTFGALNIPLSYPPEPVDGFMITGMHTPTLDKGSYPDKLYQDLLKAVPDYRIDVMCHWYEGTEPFVDDVYRMIDQRLKAAKYLYGRFRPQVFCPVFVGVDRIEHALWGQFQNGEGDLARQVPRIYRKIDEVVGELLEMVGEETNVIVISDHGFGDLKKDVYLNHFLAEAGYLHFDPAKVRSYSPPLPPENDDPRHSWYQKLLTGDDPLPDDDEKIVTGRMPRRYRSFDTVDWSKTVAYAHGLFGNIYLNVHGREPEGIVPQGREYENIRRQIADDLLKLNDPDDGLVLVDRLYRAEELYWGEAVSMAPDLLVRMRNYSYMTRGACEFVGDSLTSKPLVNHTGNHRLDGILIAHGPDMAHSQKIEGAQLIDIASTLAFGCQAIVPMDWDGRVLVNLYDDAFLRSHEVRTGDDVPGTARNKSENGLTDKETDIVRERLRSLGYLS